MIRPHVHTAVSAVSVFYVFVLRHDPREAMFLFTVVVFVGFGCCAMVALRFSIG